MFCVLGNVIMFVIILNVKCSIYTINKSVCVCAPAHDQLFPYFSRINFKHLLSY